MPDYNVNPLDPPTSIDELMRPDLGPSASGKINPTPSDMEMMKLFLGGPFAEMLAGIIGVRRGPSMDEQQRLHEMMDRAGEEAPGEEAPPLRR